MWLWYRLVIGHIQNVSLTLVIVKVDLRLIVRRLLTCPMEYIDEMYFMYMCILV